MSAQPIREVLNSGECPVCKAEIITNDTMTNYFCSDDETHFNLEVEFHGGEKMTAKLNDKPVPQDELEELDW